MYYLQVQTIILLYGLNFVTTNMWCMLGEMEYLPYDPTEWIEEPVDHFNDSDPRTFTIKYYKIMKYWKPEGPILLFLQGPNSRLPDINLDETYSKDPDSRFFVHEIAEKTGAAYFMAEHRYNGESEPFKVSYWTKENLAFITPRQVLADLYHLLTTIKKTPEFQNSKLMVVGGGHGGTLAVWLKQMYPELIDAVLANSAPLLAKVDFEEAFESVTDTFRTYGSQECVDKITEVFNTYHKMFQSPEGIANIVEEFDICDSDNMTIPFNQQYFFNILADIFLQSAMKTSAYVNTLCKGIISTELELHQLLVKNYSSRVGWGGLCSVTDLETVIDLVLTPGSLPWNIVPFQLCTIFGYFPTTSSSKQMLGTDIPLDYHIKQCKLFFGEEFDEERVNQAVINTNRMYGGLTPNVTNVVFVNGDMDPWHRLGIVQDLSADAPAIFVKGYAQCPGFYPSVNDPDSVKEARIRIINLLKKWIGQA